MNLAIRDIRRNVGRFAFTTVGIGMLLVIVIVMGMGGIYRGLIHEATLLVDRVGADLWIVRGRTRGPFAEISRIPGNLEDRARAVPGVAALWPDSFSPGAVRSQGACAPTPATPLAGSGPAFLRLSPSRSATGPPHLFRLTPSPDPIL